MSIRDRSNRTAHPDFTPITYPEGTTDVFCLYCAEPCDVRVYRDYGWPEYPHGVIVVESKCCGGPVVNAEGVEYDERDFD